MPNLILAYQNCADEATLTTTGVWASSLPVTNLQDRIMSNVARSAGVSAADTKIDIALPKYRKVKVVALCRHNLGTDATYRVTAYLDSAHTSLIYDSGFVAVWPAMYTTYSLEWQDDNWWGGRPALEDRQGYRWNLIHICPSTVYAPYWRIEIVDTANPDGYVEAGRLFIGDGWQPTYNRSYGSSLRYESRSAVEEALDGTEYFDKKTAPRIAQFSLDWLTPDEAMDRALEIQRLADVSGEILYIYDPSDTKNMIRRSFLARSRSLSAIEHPYLNTHKTAYELKEIL